MTKCIYLAWQDQNTRQWHVIGQLLRNDKGYEFRYTKGVKNIHSFSALSSMPEHEKGIAIVDGDFLEKTTFERDANGRIIVLGDGLFTTMKNVPLLNKSGDAHAIVFEAQEAVGIIVGSWRCLGKDIVNLMLDHFKQQNIPFDQITVRIGPGLDAETYSIGTPTYDELKKVYGEALESAVQPKPGKNNDNIEKMLPHVPELLKEYEEMLGCKVEFTPKVKYLLNVPKLMQKYSEMFGFNVDISESRTTFDRKAWQAVKAEAIDKHDPQLPLSHYQQSNFFSARQYVRCVRLAGRIAKQNGLPQPEQLAFLAPNIDPEDIKKAGEQGRYNETGRCLNGVRRR